MKKSSTAILAVFVGFLCVLVGAFWGRNSAKSHINLTQATLPSSSTESYPISNAADLGSNFGKININTAPLSLLRQLPGIGDTIAQRIIDYREENGPFVCTSDITNVYGIGQKRFQEIQSYITTGG